MVRFRLLGPVEIRGDSGWASAGPPQQRSVLAALLADAGRLVSAEALIDRVWSEGTPAAARRSLHSHLARIRRLLADIAAGGPPVARLLSRSGSYQLDVATELVDWHRFRKLLTAADSDGVPTSVRARLLRDALDLWQGTPLADLDTDWAARTRDSWAQQRLDAVVSWGQAELSLDRPHEVIGPTRELVTEYPLVEPLAAVLLQALAMVDRPAEALAHYAAIRDRLIDDLGAEPGPQLQAVHQAILRGELTASQTRPASISTWAVPVPAQLPADIPGFVGRRGELGQLDLALDLLAAEPTAVVVCAISGTPGVGKTSLAVHWAHRVRQQFPDGQLHLNLRGFDPTDTMMNPAEALRRFLEALNIPSQRVPPSLDARAAMFRSTMDGRRILIVLDNARDAAHVDPLMPGTPGCLVVVTSRNQLTSLVMAGARPLVLDRPSVGEAREMIARRLGAERVAAEPESVDDIISACARLPLALSIATARAQQTGFPLATIAAELDGSDGRLTTLDGGEPAGQLTTAFSSSYTLLTPLAARLFHLLGLHPGPDISASAAAALAGHSMTAARQLLAELTRASLVAEHRPDRYTVHDLLRVYARHLVSDTDAEAGLERFLGYHVRSAAAADRVLEPARDRTEDGLGSARSDGQGRCGVRPRGVDIVDG